MLMWKKIIVKLTYEIIHTVFTKSISKVKLAVDCKIIHNQIFNKQVEIRNRKQPGKSEPQN